MHLIQSELIGSNTAQIFASYFNPLEGGASRPIALVFKGQSGELRELSASGNGEIKLSKDPLGKLFFDKCLGHSCIAPLILTFDGNLDGSEEIVDVLIDEMQNKTKIVLFLDNFSKLKIQLEDDELYINLEDPS